MRNRQALRVSVAVAASLGVHFAAAMVATPGPPPVLVEGGKTAEIAALGSSFEDLLQGSNRLAPADPAPAKPVKAQSAEKAEPAEPAIAKPARPVETAQAERVMVEPVAYRAETTPAPPEKLTGTIAVPRQAPAEPEAAEAVEPVAPVRPLTVETASTAEPVEAAKPAEIAALTPSHAAEIVLAEPETPPIPVPLARPPQPEDQRNLAKAREAQQRKETERAQMANVARGNSDRNARAGNAQGEADSRARAGGSESGGKASKAGNAEASNYPGKVYSRIRRTRQKRAGGTGVVRVRFSIAANGGLASVRVAASSGSSSVDNVAVDHIRRSAPFPPPPAGAQRQFVIPVEVRR